jgi:hypothetical protein
MATDRHLLQHVACKCALGIRGVDVAAARLRFRQARVWHTLVAAATHACSIGTNCRLSNARSGSPSSNSVMRVHGLAAAGESPSPTPITTMLSGCWLASTMASTVSRNDEPAGIRPSRLRLHTEANSRPLTIRYAAVGDDERDVILAWKEEVNRDHSLLPSAAPVRLTHSMLFHMAGPNDVGPYSRVVAILVAAF